MKFFKRFAILGLAASLVMSSTVYAADSNILDTVKGLITKDDKPDEKEESDEKSNEKANKGEDVVKGFMNKLSGVEFSESDYYEYLKTEVVEKGEGLASLSSARIRYDNKRDLFVNNHCNGLLSAEVRDFNNDGMPEMVTFSMDVFDEKDTLLGKTMRYAGDSIGIRADLYTGKSGNIERTDSVYIAQIASDSFGLVSACVRKSAGTDYIVAIAKNEDTTTYGSEPITYYHVEDDKFVLDLVSGFIGWGQSKSNVDANTAMGSLRTDFSNTTLNEVVTNLNAIYKYAPDRDDYQKERFNKLNGIICCYAYMDRPDSDNMSNYQAYDFTHLNDIFSQGYDSFIGKNPKVELSDVPEPVDESSYKVIYDVIADVDKNAGISCTKTSESHVDGKHLFGFQATTGVGITLQSNDAGELTYIRVSADKMTDNFILVKDAVLASETIGLDQSAISGRYGNCEFNTSTPIDVVRGGKLTVGAVVDTFLIISW